MINIIKSKDNDKIKYTKSLLKTKGRTKEKKFIIEGYRILTLALECDAKLEYVFINEDFEKKQEHRDFLIELENKGIKVYKTLNKIFSEMVDTENTQGILAVLEYKERDLVNNINQDDKFVLILDRIQDPGNMGTIIRTADSAGVDAVILLKGCVDIYNPKVIRSTMGSIFDMNIIHATQDDAVNFLKSNDFNIVSSYLQTDNYYHETTYDGKIALVIGNEANGINDELIAQYDSILEGTGCKYYIIVGDTDDPELSVDMNKIYIGMGETPWEQALSKAYGDHFINMRLYMIQNGLSDCGLEATDEDLDGFTRGEISQQLRADWTHFNAYGYYAKAKGIYEKGVELGYWGGQ